MLEVGGTESGVVPAAASRTARTADVEALVQDLTDDPSVGGIVATTRT